MTSGWVGRRTWVLGAVAASSAWLASACGSTGANTTASTSSTALASALASATDATGTLLCTPSQAQLDACSGSSAGAACSLAATTDGGAATAGTCRTTLDGSAVACAPNPPAPPQALVDACAGKAAGDACSATEPDGDAHEGVCVTDRGGATLVCGRTHNPPQALVDACSGQSAGASCTMPARGDAGAAAGVCSLGTAGTGVLACAPAQELRPSATSACAGLAAGATCAVGHGRGVSGTCVTPQAGGDPVCVAACADLGGSFRCGPEGGHGGGPGHGEHR